MDLTKEYPSSVYAKWQGVVQLARAIDKGKAVAQGTEGEYHYNCPLDKEVFSFLNIDHEALLGVIKNAKSDAEIEAFTKEFVGKKSAEEIETWNNEFLTNCKPSGESLQYFLNLRNQVAPDRTDVATWPDLLDLDEKRSVPKRETVLV